MDDKTTNAPPPERFKKFNGGLAYYLDNIFKFVFVIFKFFIKLSGLMLFTFPILVFGMCLVAPDAAVKSLETIVQLIQTTLNIFN
jgi:hypothetical protein